MLTYRKVVAPEGNPSDVANYRLPSITNLYSPENLPQTPVPLEGSVFE